MSEFQKTETVEKKKWHKKYGEETWPVGKEKYDGMPQPKKPQRLKRKQTNNKTIKDGWRQTKKNTTLSTERHKERQRAIRSANENSWRKYTEQLTNLCNKSPRQFYKSWKTRRLRDEFHTPMLIINNKERRNFIKKRRQKLFQEFFWIVQEKYPKV